MKHSALVLGVLAIGLAAATPARADFAVVQFGDGFCQIWSDTTATPWGTGWTKLAVSLPDWDVAHAALDNAIVQGACR